jgi:hypothetical protein
LVLIRDLVEEEEVLLVLLEIFSYNTWLLVEVVVVVMMIMVLEVAEELEDIELMFPEKHLVVEQPQKVLLEYF